MMALRSPFIIVLAALILTACAMAGAVSGPAAPARTQSLHCALRLTETGGQVAAEARVQSPAPLSGTYALHIVGADGGTAIHQSGDFRVSGQSPVILGSAALSGSADDYATTLTLRTGAQVLDCPVEHR